MPPDALVPALELINKAGFVGEVLPTPEATASGAWDPQFLVDYFHQFTDDAADLVDAVISEITTTPIAWAAALLSPRPLVLLTSTTGLFLVELVD
jgi:hypothetical protein